MAFALSFSFSASILLLAFNIMSSLRFCNNACRSVLFWLHAGDFPLTGASPSSAGVDTEAASFSERLYRVIRSVYCFGVLADGDAPEVVAAGAGGALERDVEAA